MYSGCMLKVRKDIDCAASRLFKLNNAQLQQVIKDEKSEVLDVLLARRIREVLNTGNLDFIRMLLEVPIDADAQSNCL